MDFLPRSLLLSLFAAGCHADSPHEALPLPAPATALTGPRHGAILFLGTIAPGPGASLEEAYPVLIRHKVDSLHLPYVVINAGLINETTAGGCGRIGQVLRHQLVRVVVLGLGGNDARHGLSLRTTRRHLQALIDTVRRQAPQASVVLAGMPISSATGSKYTADFKQLYAEAALHNRLVFIPFLPASNGRASPAHTASTATQTVWRAVAPLL